LGAAGWGVADGTGELVWALKAKLGFAIKGHVACVVVGGVAGGGNAVFGDVAGDELACGGVIGQAGVDMKGKKQKKKKINRNRPVAITDTARIAIEMIVFRALAVSMQINSSIQLNNQ
jgi:hypothetical protein